jgi:hypothetical protein
MGAPIDLHGSYRADLGRRATSPSLSVDPSPSYDERDRKKDSNRRYPIGVGEPSRKIFQATQSSGDLVHGR